MLCIILALFACLYLVVTPPFENPDEPAHFARAYGIAQGQFILKTHPRELVGFVKEKMARHTEFHNYLTHTLETTPGRIPNLAFNTAVYSPIPYLGYAAAIKLTPHTGPSNARFLTAFYLSRGVALILFLTALFQIPSTPSTLKWPMLWVASTPMLLTQAAAISTDGILFGMALLILLKSTQHHFSWKTIAMLLMSGGILLQTKPVYGPIFLIPFTAILFSQDKDRYRKAVCFSIGVVGILLPALYWNHMIKTKGVLDHFIQVGAMAGYGKADASAQLSLIFNHPLHFPTVLMNTATRYGADLYHQFVGVLAWLDTPLPLWSVVLWGIAAIASLFAVNTVDLPIFPLKRQLLGSAYLLGALIALLAIVGSAYLIWMGVGADVILLQGRYFHVIAAMMLPGIALLLPRHPSPDRTVKIQWALVGTSIVINGSALFTLIQKFHTL